MNQKQEAPVMSNVMSKIRLRSVANQKTEEVKTDEYDRDSLFLNALAKSVLYEKELKEREAKGMTALQKLEALVRDNRKRLGLSPASAPPEIIRSNTPPPAKPASVPAPTSEAAEQMLDIYNHPTTLLGSENTTDSAETYIIEYRSREVNPYMSLTGATIQHLENTGQMPEAIIIPSSMLPRYRAKIEEIQNYYTGLFYFANQAIAIRTENELPKWVTLILSGDIPRDFLYTVSRDLPVKRIS